MMIRTYRVILEPDENNTFHAFVPALPGCHTWGETIADAKKNIKDAMQLYVADVIEAGESVPDEQSFDTFETVMFPAVV